MAKKSIKRRLLNGFLILILANAAFIGIFLLVTFQQEDRKLEAARAEMASLKGENKELSGNSYDKKLAVTCDNGTFVGRMENDVRSYRGIPFAKPPVEDLRWKAPVDAGKDDGVYEALYYGKSGIQTEAASERASLYDQGEDCLTLNVWTAASSDTSSQKPVMVFFPGGGFGWGGTADPIYDGQNFAEAHPDIVLVTANYRIGLMGFIDFSAVEGGDDYKESGNLGLLDQLSALSWVNRNIEQFGGDPENVTIFGESAGAASVSLLPLIPDSEGLFKRVIAQSGSLALTYSREESQALTEMLLKKAKAKTMDDLLALSEADLMKLNEGLNDYNNFPERDGILLPEDLYEAYASGKASHIDMLSGTNADEVRYWIEEVGGYPIYRLAGRLLYGSTVERLNEEDRPLAEAFLALQDEEAIWAQTEFLNDLLFRVPAIRQAELHAANGGRSYMYYWAKESAIEHFGAAHAVELSYVFNNLEDTIFTGEPADESLAQTVQEMWVNFAKTGDPSTDGHPWKPYVHYTRQTLFLGDEIRMESDPLSLQRTLIEPLLKYHFNGYYLAVDYALIYLRSRVIRVLLVVAAANAVILLVVKLRKRKKIKNRNRTAG